MSCGRPHRRRAGRARRRDQGRGRHRHAGAARPQGLRRHRPARRCAARALPGSTCWSAMPAFSGRSRRSSHVEPKVLDEVMAVNVTANWRLIRAWTRCSKLRRRARGLRHLGRRAGACAYLGGLRRLQGRARDLLARTYAAETRSTNVRVNLFNPGPIRTRMRAQAMPGEDPMTLETPEKVAEKIVDLCLPSMQDSGKLYFPTRSASCSSSVRHRGRQDRRPSASRTLTRRTPARRAPVVPRSHHRQRQDQRREQECAPGRCQALDRSDRT